MTKPVKILHIYADTFLTNFLEPYKKIVENLKFMQMTKIDTINSEGIPLEIWEPLYNEQTWYNIGHCNEEMMCILHKKVGYPLK